MKGVKYGERDGKRIKEMKRINEGGMEEEGMRDGWKSDGGIDPILLNCLFLGSRLFTCHCTICTPPAGDGKAILDGGKTYVISLTRTGWFYFLRSKHTPAVI